MANKKTYLLSAILVGVISLGAFAGGQGEEAGTTSDAGRLESVGFNATGYPIVEEKVTVNAIIQRPGHVTNAYDDQTVLEELQQRTNVDIVFEEVPSGQVQEKTNLMFASREFPEVIFVAGVSDRNLYEAGQGGDVWPLGDLVEEYAPNWQQAFEERPVIKNAITAPDGNIYSLPYYREILNDYGIRDITAFNVDWLEKVGKDMPSDTEELYDVLTAFKAGIEDGTLPSNGVPWYFYYHSWVGGEWEVYNMFGLWMKGQGSGAQRYLSVNDGTVEFGATDPKLVDAVNYLHRLYSEGLIPEEVFTDSWEDYLTKTRSVPPISGMWGSYFIVGAVEEWYDPLPVIEGPTGVKRYRSQPVRLQKNQFTIFTKFDMPEVMIRWIDAFAEAPFSIEASYGGPMIQRQDDGTMTVVGAGTEWYEHGPHNQFPAYISKAASDKVNWTGDQGNRDKYIREHYQDYLWPQDRHFAYITFTDAEQEELAIYETEIGDYVESTLADWIVNGTAEEQWSQYIDELQRLGLDDVMDIYQTAYDRFQAK